MKITNKIYQRLIKCRILFFLNKSLKGGKVKKFKYLIFLTRI